MIRGLTFKGVSFETNIASEAAAIDCDWSVLGGSVKDTVILGDLVVCGG